MKINTWCPLFPGFYGTIYEPDEQLDIDDINEKRRDINLRPLDFDAFEFDYDTYRNDVADEFCNEIYGKFSELGFNVEIKFQSVSSPKFYNYSNDSINIEATFDVDQINQYLIYKVEQFRAYVKEKYTPCEGFISHYPNNSDDWHYNDAWSKDEHMAGSVFEFILLNEEVDHSQFCIDTNIQCTNYNELIKGIDEELDELNNDLMGPIVEQINKAGGRIFGEVTDNIFFEINGQFHSASACEGRVYWSNKYPLPDFVEHFEADFNLR